MSNNLDSQNSERLELLRIPDISPPIASSSRSVSQTSSYGGSGSKRLSFAGHCVNVILPTMLPELPEWIDDILLKVENIHDVEDQEVIFRNIGVAEIVGLFGDE